MLAISDILNILKKAPVQKAIMTVCLIIGSLIAIKIILSLFDKFLKKSKLDTLVGKILRTTLKAFLLFTATIIVLGNLGIPVSSLIALLSIIGVALSLAVQGFLSNVFGGIQIITNRPFTVGDYVEAGGQSGTVREVGLFYTKLDTPDKKLVQLPNSKIANDGIINYSHAPKRRVEILISLSYDDDTDKVRAVMLQLLTEHPLVLKEEGIMPVVNVKEFRDNDICYTARAWVENKNYWKVYYDIMNTVKPTLDKNGISFSYPHMNVHMINQ